MLLWFHGGGWVTGNLDTHDQLGRLLADAVGAVVVSVDYRLAPEAKFPAAADDCLAAYEWALAHADEVGADPARVAIGGDSAGGNLAAVVALDARERGLPQPKLQLLVYPVTDYELDSASMIDNAKGYFLEADTMRWFWDHYARTPADFADRACRRCAPPISSGLARAVVVTAEYDPLRDQGEAYGARLPRRAGPDRGRARRRSDPRLLRYARRSCRPAKKRGTYPSPRCGPSSVPSDAAASAGPGVLGLR